MRNNCILDCFYDIKTIKLIKKLVFRIFMIKSLNDKIINSKLDKILKS